jgi:CIC family chloride channel protein
VFISFYGEATLFGQLHHYPFIPAHLPLYALMAVIVSFVARGFLATLRWVQDITKKMRVPEWSKPAIGGLALGCFATPIVMLIGPHVGQAGQGLGVLGGGYGAAQVALTVVKIFATAFTVGSGGSAGDFGPSLVIGAIFGGAFGRLAQLLLHDPRIDPGAFALVGMGTFYGGLAHVPIASLVMVCELAGSYELLVPLMFAEGIAFVALRDRSLYHAQVATRRESAAHRDDLIYDVLRGVTVENVMVKNREYVTFEPRTTAIEVMRSVAGSEWQDAFPVIDGEGKLAGVVNAEILRTLATAPGLETFALAADLMVPAASVSEEDDLHTALEQMLKQGVRELLVTNEKGQIVGFLDEADITRAYHGATASVVDADERRGERR